jgi:hypothetical protein
LALSLAERAAYLAAVCGDDEQMRLEVERMLASHERRSPSIGQRR